MRSTDRGVGTDQQSDVGSPASINLADGLRRRLLRKEDRPMDGERMERDPMEEGQGVHSPGAGGWQEHNDMQAR